MPELSCRERALLVALRAVDGRPNREHTASSLSAGLAMHFADSVALASTAEALIAHGLVAKRYGRISGGVRANVYEITLAGRRAVDGEWRSPGFPLRYASEPSIEEVTPETADTLRWEDATDEQRDACIRGDLALLASPKQIGEWLRRRWSAHDWGPYLTELGLSRGQVGDRVLEAYAAGYDRAQVAAWLSCSVGYVSTLASIARAGQ